MLKKRLGAECIEKSWSLYSIYFYYRIPSTIIIPEGCERIGDWAFGGCRGLKRVVIPEGVKEIGNCAFRGCDKLKKVDIPGSVVVIGDETFCYCYQATIIHEKPISMFKHVGKDAFGFCKSVRCSWYM